MDTVPLSSRLFLVQPRKEKMMARIAIVEDDVDVSRTIRDMLRESGHEVVSYLQPSTDIVEHLRMLHPELVIVDARLSEAVSGWDIISSLRSDEFLASMPIVLCTAATDETTTHRDWLRSHNVPVIIKPVSLDDLENTVNELLART